VYLVVGNVDDIISTRNIWIQYRNVTLKVACTIKYEGHLDTTYR